MQDVKNLCVWRRRIVLRDKRKADYAECMKKQGFTLVEMLVVVLIIAVLAALLFPALSKARERGRMVQCQSNLRQLHIAVMNHASSGGRFPYAMTHEYFDDIDQRWKERKGWVTWRIFANPGSATANKTSDWFEMPPTYKGMLSITNGTLWSYIRDERVYVCPTFKREAERQLQRQAATRTAVVMRSYVMNSQLSYANMFSIQNASRRLLFADGSLYNRPTVPTEAQSSYLGLLHTDGRASFLVNTWHYNNAPVSSDGTRFYYRNADGRLEGTQWSATPAPGRPYEQVGCLHGGLANCVFADGHIERIAHTNTIAVSAGSW